MGPCTKPYTSYGTEESVLDMLEWTWRSSGSESTDGYLWHSLFSILPIYLFSTWQLRMLGFRLNRLATLHSSRDKGKASWTSKGRHWSSRLLIESRGSGFYFRGLRTSTENALRRWIDSTTLFGNRLKNVPNLWYILSFKT